MRMFWSWPSEAGPPTAPGGGDPLGDTPIASPTDPGGRQHQRGGRCNQRPHQPAGDAEGHQGPLDRKTGALHRKTAGNVAAPAPAVARSFPKTSPPVVNDPVERAGAPLPAAATRFLWTGSDGLCHNKPGLSLTKLPVAAPGYRPELEPSPTLFILLVVALADLGSERRSRCC